MTKLLDSTLVLCDLDHLLLAGDGNMPQVVRDVLQLFSSQGGEADGLQPAFAPGRPRRAGWTAPCCARAHLRRYAGLPVLGGQRPAAVQLRGL